MIYNITIIGNKLHFQTQLDSSPAFLCIPASFLCIPVHSCLIPVYSCLIPADSGLIPVDSCGFLWIPADSCGFLRNPEIPEGICRAVRSTGFRSPPTEMQHHSLSPVLASVSGCTSGSQPPPAPFVASSSHQPAMFDNLALPPTPTPSALSQ